jgi:hypothetical protein
MQDRQIILAAPATKPLYRGWLVVAAAFLVAMFGFGLGFYGPGLYLVALKARHGWSTEELSSAITLYYILGATLLFLIVDPCSSDGVREWSSQSAPSQWPAGWSC